MVPRFDDTPTEPFVPKHLKEYAQDVRDYVAQKAEQEIKDYVDPVVIAKKEPTKPVELVYDEKKCNPKTCWGECDGKGWCHIAQEWQKKIKHHNSFIKFVKVKKQKKMSKSKRKALKRQWRKRHNR